MARIIQAFSQFFDDNGDPLVDGFLQFYESGTTTDKNTYADVNLSIANTNPVELSGAGRCRNVFGTGSYKVISFDSAMQQIQVFDPVGGDAASSGFTDWNSPTIYTDGDIVTGSDGLYYRSITSGNQNQDPISSAGNWEEVRFIDVYNLNITYAEGDLVVDSVGHLYRSLASANTNNTPADNPDKWGDATSIANLSANTLTHNMTSDADYTLSTAENLYGRVIITDTNPFLSTGRNIVVSATERLFIAQNDTLQTLTLKTAAGTGVAILAGSSVELQCDGTNVIVPSRSISDGTSEIPKSTVIAGSAKAWVSFNGTGAVAILGSFNVSSIIDGGVGVYTMNFITDMPNTNYACMGNTDNTTNFAAVMVGIKALSTCGLSVGHHPVNTLEDKAYVAAAVLAY